MTIEEAIETIKTAIAEVEWEYPMNYAAAFEVAIKALEQQSVLDKIREEIEQVSFNHYFEYGEYYGEDTRQERIVNFNSVTQIIDKYKESEE